MTDYPEIVETAYEATVRDLFLTMFHGLASGDETAIDRYRTGLKIAQRARDAALAIPANGEQK